MNRGLLSGLALSLFCFLSLSSLAGDSTQTLILVKTAADVVKAEGKKVKLIGRYETDKETSISDDGDPLSMGIYVPQSPLTPQKKKAEPYRFVRIVLEDGTFVSLFDPLNKGSLRSPEEHKTYHGRTLEIIGTLHRVGIKRSSEFFIDPDKWPGESR